MKRMTLAAIGLAAALVLIPTVIAVAQAGPTEARAGTHCPYYEQMMGEGRMGMMGQGRMGMMGQGRMGMMGQDRMGMMGQDQTGMMGMMGQMPEDCPMRDAHQG